MTIAVRLIAAVQRGSRGALCRAARRVVPAALGALRSPLAAAPAARAFDQLRHALLPPDQRLAAVGDTIARLTLRLDTYVTCTWVCSAVRYLSYHGGL